MELAQSFPCCPIKLMDYQTLNILLTISYVLLLLNISGKAWMPLHCSDTKMKISCPSSVLEGKPECSMLPCRSSQTSARLTWSRYFLVSCHCLMFISSPGPSWMPGPLKPGQPKCLQTLSPLGKRWRNEIMPRWKPLLYDKLSDFYLQHYPERRLAVLQWTPWPFYRVIWAALIHWAGLNWASLCRGTSKDQRGWHMGNLKSDWKGGGSLCFIHSNTCTCVVSVHCVEPVSSPGDCSPRSSVFLPVSLAHGGFLLLCTVWLFS